MFPEGTRRTGPTIDPDHMRDGVAYVASRAQIPIVPGGHRRRRAGHAPEGEVLPARPRWSSSWASRCSPPPLKESGRVSRSAVRALTDDLRTTLQRLFDDAQERAGTPNG